MKRIIVHQWRDWLLEYVGDGKYEFIRKNDRSIYEVEAKNHMDAENQCQKLIHELTVKEEASE